MICDQGVEYHRGRIRASDDIIMQQSNLTRDRSRSIIEGRQWQVCMTIKSNKLIKQSQLINNIHPIDLHIVSSSSLTVVSLYRVLPSYACSKHVKNQHSLFTKPATQGGTSGVRTY
jgi:hypothetical protein